MAATNLRSWWTTRVLHLTSFITNKKESLQTLHGIRVFTAVISVIAAELALLVFSLPLYVAETSIKSPDATTTKQYRLRRALTLGTVFSVLGIWLLKLLIIIIFSFLVQTRGNISINETVNNLGNTDTTAHDVLVAVNDPKLAPPTVDKVQDIHGQIGLWGTAPAGDAVVFAFTENKTGSPAENTPPKLYIAWVDASGHYELLEDSKIFNLPAGEYTVSAITYDALHKSKSTNSRTITLDLDQSLSETLFHAFDLILNILALIAVLMGVLVTVLVT